VVSFPFFRNRWYEIFLRAHQSLAVASVIGVWVHVVPQSLLSRAHVYALVGIAGCSAVLLGTIVVYRNGLFRYGWPRAEITHSKGAVLVTVALSRPIHVKAGQHVSLWVFVPSTSFHSLIEYHPFVIASWSNGPLDTLGLTRHLLHRSQTRPDACPALFSGPHGRSIPVGENEVVLMVASGYGIATQLPCLKQLLHDYNSRQAKSRRIHLVWTLKTLGTSYCPAACMGLTFLDLAMAVESLLNHALVSDTLDDGYVSKTLPCTWASSHQAADPPNLRVRRKGQCTRKIESSSGGY
jgi:Ferric reductase NAD binding domain